MPSSIDKLSLLLANMGAQPVPELELDNQGQISLSSLPSTIEKVVRQENLNITRVMLIKIALKYAELKNKRKSNEENMQSLLETTMSSINTLMTNKVRPTFRLPRKHTPTELNAYLEEIESLNVDDYEKINIIISQVHGPTKDAALMIPDKSDFIKFCNQLKDNLYPLQNNRYEAKKELLKIRPYSRETIINFLNRVGAQIQISNETLTNKLTDVDIFDIHVELLSKTKMKLFRVLNSHPDNVTELKKEAISQLKNSYSISKTFATQKSSFRNQDTFNKRENVQKSNSKPFFHKKENKKIHVVDEEDENDEEDFIEEILIINDKQLKKTENIVIGEKKLNVTALLDTGSDVNLISKNVIHTLKSIGENITTISYKSTVQGIEKNPLKILGQVDISMYGNKVKFLVLPELDYELIICKNTIKNVPFLKFLLIKSLEYPLVNEKEKKLKNILLKKYKINFEDKAVIPSQVIPPIQWSMIENKPTASKIRPIPKTQIEAISKEIKILLDKKIIKPCMSEWNSCLVPIKKEGKDGSISYRLCVDYKSLNKQIRKPVSILPQPKQILAEMFDKKCFSVIDLKHGYYNLRVDEKLQDMLAFTFLSKQYTFQALPQGITIGPYAFQTILQNNMEDLLNKYKGKIHIFIDDLLISTISEDENIKIVHEVCQRLEKLQLNVNVQKMQLLRNKVEYLGIYLKPIGIGIAQKHVQKVLKFKEPKSKKDIQSFLGLCSYFRNFIHNFAQTAQPLYNLLVPNKKIEWTNETKNAYEQLKSMIEKAPILKHLDYDGALTNEKPIRIFTDASLNGIGSVITQEEVIDGKKHYNIISFYSRALSKAEQRYPAMELECLAAVSTLQAMRYQLWGLPIQIISDNKQLCSLLISGNLSLRLLKWSMLLGEFNISNIVYLPGSKNVIADAMSRVIEHCDIPDDEEFPTPILSVCSISELTNKIPNECEWYRIQNTDEIFLELRKNVLNKSTTPKLTDEFGKKQFEIGKNGLITYNKKIVLNKEYATYILKMIHETNHINAESMCSQFNRVYYAKNRTVLALNIVRDCKTCFHNKEIITNRKVIEKEKVDKPFELGSMDYGYSECYKQYFLLLRDGFSNFAYATWVKNFSSKVIIQFLESIFQNYAVYKNIKCDNQTGFKSNEIRKYLESKGVNIKFSNSYEKWSNGKAERAIKSIKNHLKIFYKLNKSKGIALQLAISKSRDTIYHHEKSPRELHFNTSNLSSINTIRNQNTLNSMRYIWRRGNYKVNDEKKDCDIIAQIGKKTFIIKDKEKFIKTTLVNVGKEKIPDHEKKELAKKVQPFLRTENFFPRREMLHNMHI